MYRSPQHRCVSAILNLGLILAVSAWMPAASGQSAVPLNQAGMEWRLLGRAVARIQTATATGTGFLISNDFLVTSASIVEGLLPEQIYVVFSHNANQQTNSETQAGQDGEFWRVSSILYVPLEGCANAAVLRLHPKRGVTAGELYGYFGARADDPLAGEPAHIIAVESASGLLYTRTDGLLDADTGVCRSGGMLSFAYPTEMPVTSDGAPVLDDAGCLIGMQCASGNHQALAVNINHLRRMMPDNGCPLETCMLGVEHEYHFDTVGGVLKEVGGLAVAQLRSDDPRLGYFSERSYGTSSLDGPPRYSLPPYDYPDVPPGYRDVPPPVGPDLPTPNPHDPRKPPPPDDPNTPVPEPATLLLLAGALLAGRSWLRQR